MPDYSQMVAYFVGGPENGTTKILPNDTREQLVVEQAPLVNLIQLQSYRWDTSTVKIKAHRYVRTKEMQNKYLRGCYIFEWMGEA